jgi:tripartite-type tricarboxylate transporter receptor subunit TctC
VRWTYSVAFNLKSKMKTGAQKRQPDHGFGKDLMKYKSQQLCQPIPENKTRRPACLCLATTCFIIAAICHPAAAQSNYPNRPIRMIVAFAPGGIADIVARLVSNELSNCLGQPIYVDNKGGGAGELGAKRVSSSEPDGYTLLVTTTAVAITAAAQPSDVNPRSQLTPLALAARAPTLFAVKVPPSAKNFMDFLQTRSNGQLTYASAGTGTTEHLTGAYVFKSIPGLVSVHIPYRSGGEAVEAVLGGHVDVAATPSASALPLLREGKLQALAVASHKRVPMFPQVPTLAETGLTDVENFSWIAVFGPAGLPQDVVSLLGTKLRDAMRQPQLRDRLSEMGFDLPEVPQSQLVEFMGNEVTKWGQILNATGVALE